MTSFSNYTQYNNCNLMIKNSLIFALYNKNLKKNELYTKTNNSIKGFYKDNILNDSIYFASNGIKKNSIFRKKEINTIQNNFVSYFSAIEDDFSIFNIYPQKYFSNLINNYLNNQTIITNYLQKKSNPQKINSIFLTNYRSFKNSINITKFQEKSTKKLFIKNYFDKSYFIDGNGFISKLDNKLFSKQLFSGLLYILPQKIQFQLKNLFLLNYLLLNFFNNIKSKNYENITLKYTIILYSFFFKYLNFSIKTYFSINNIKIRKSNWLLYKFTKIYLNPLNKLINYYFHIVFKSIKNFNQIEIISNFLLTNNIQVSKKLLNFNNINSKLKIGLINLFLKQIYIKYPIKYNFFVKNKLIYNYIKSKAALIQYLLKKYLTYNLINLTIYNYIHLLNFQIHTVINTNYILDNHILNNNNIFKISTSNIKQSNFILSRNFLSWEVLKQYINFNKKLFVNRYPYITLISNLNILKKKLNKLKRSLNRNKKNLRKNFQNFQNSSLIHKNLKFKQLKYPWLKFYNLTNYKKIISNKLYKIK